MLKLKRSACIVLKDNVQLWKRARIRYQGSCYSNEVRHLLAWFMKNILLNFVVYKTQEKKWSFLNDPTKGILMETLYEVSCNVSFGNPEPNFQDSY